MDHKELDVWKKSIELVSELYALTRSFPKEELYGLTGQIRRCAISIPSNIAEGAARNSKKEFIQFLYIALGSASELETQLIIAINLEYIKAGSEITMNKVIAVKQMLLGMIRHLKRK